MHLLERLASRFNEAGIELMSLGTAAMTMLLDLEPGARPLLGLDLMVRPESFRAATRLLEDLGSLRSEVVFREDLYPKYRHAVEFTAGLLAPVSVTLHARPFGPLRYARLVPDDAMWQRAEPAKIGSATLLIPSSEDMLAHLAVRSAVGGNTRVEWLSDIKQWTSHRGPAIDWQRFLARVASWHLARPVRSALTAATIAVGEVCPPEVRRRLAEMPTGWRDRLVLWHAVRGDANTTSALVVSLVTTPGWGFKLRYLRDLLCHDRSLRCSGLIVRDSGIHGCGVFAKRAFKKGDIIGRYRGRESDHDGPYTAWHTDEAGNQSRHEITGPLRFLNHSCRPLAKFDKFKLIAVEPIGPEREVTIDYGSCKCRRTQAGAPDGR